MHFSKVAIWQDFRLERAPRVAVLDNEMWLSCGFPNCFPYCLSNFLMPILLFSRLYYISMPLVYLDA